MRSAAVLDQALHEVGQLLDASALLMPPHQGSQPLWEEHPTVARQKDLVSTHKEQRGKLIGLAEVLVMLLQELARTPIAVPEPDLTRPPQNHERGDVPGDLEVQREARVSAVSVVVGAEGLDSEGADDPGDEVGEGIGGSNSPAPRSRGCGRE